MTITLRHVSGLTCRNFLRIRKSLPRTSTADENKVEVWIVPEGATFDQPTTPVNETRVKPQSRKPAAAPAKRASKPRRKAAAPKQ